MRLLDNEHFDVTDFLERWVKARHAALGTCLMEHGIEADTSALDEPALLALVPPAARDQVLRRVFDNSRRLALSAARAFNLCFEVEDFASLLIAAEVPCALGTSERRPGAWVMRRPACALVENVGHFACDYYREASDGLIMGGGDDERFARHACAGHGDAECLDILYLDSSAATDAGFKWQPVPDQVSKRLRPVTEAMTALGADLEFKGYGEGTLFFTLKSASGPNCGSTVGNLHDRLRTEVRAIFPHFRLQDVMPLAVYGDQHR